MKDTDIILLPNPARVMEGLRDTGYEFNTAIADIIDNSIAADAQHIRIHIGQDVDGEILVYIADDGYGMDMDGLKNAMTYGSAEREDAASLGKFGLGLKTASTAFCRCLSVVSRGSDSTVRKVQWDLDYIVKTGQWNLRVLDTEFDELEFLDSVAGGKTGTLVIWQKIDRMFRTKTGKNSRKSLKTIIKGLSFHISLVYQRFLDPEDSRARNVEIVLNDESIKAWNPFFPSEENTTLLYDRPLPIRIDDDHEIDLMIRAYLLPRTEEFSTPDIAKDAHISNDMQGFYTYRENRLIHYGDWMGMYQNEPHGSLLRVELSFDNRLDTAFQVDIKKSRILLDENIFNYLKDKVIPPFRREADKRYRRGVDKKVSESSKDTHAASNHNIESKAPFVESSKASVIDRDKGSVQVVNSKGTFVTHHIAIREPDVPGQTRVVPTENLEDGVLWRPALVDGDTAVEINTSHPYYQKIYYPLRNNSVMITGMDALLWALCEAEQSLGYTDVVQEMYEEMRVQVSRNLKKLLADMPEQVADDEE